MSTPSLQFEIHPSSGVPIYRQLMDQIQALATSGRLSAGSLLPSVRQLAADLEINMMTVSKAYAKLEADGVLERDRGVGMRVKAVPIALSGKRDDRQQELRSEADRLVLRAWQLGLTLAETQSVVEAAFLDRELNSVPETTAQN